MVKSVGLVLLHVDVMDGHFVPNISWGMPVVKCLRKETSAFLDCHMMVSAPEQWIQAMADAGANMYTFHIEATTNATDLIAQIRSANMKVGVAVKPNTPIEDVLPICPLVDMVLVMTVEPGFGGQSFMIDMMPKVSTLRQQFPNLDIQVDGGIDALNVDVATKAGANCIVSGSGIFNYRNNVKSIIQSMKDSVQRNTRQAEEGGA